MLWLTQDVSVSVSEGGFGKSHRPTRCDIGSQCLSFLGLIWVERNTVPLISLCMRDLWDNVWEQNTPVAYKRPFKPIVKPFKKFCTIHVSIETSSEENKMDIIHRILWWTHTWPTMMNLIYPEAVEPNMPHKWLTIIKLTMSTLTYINKIPLVKKKLKTEKQFCPWWKKSDCNGRNWLMDRRSKGTVNFLEIQLKQAPPTNSNWFIKRGAEVKDKATPGDEVSSFQWN